MKHVRRISKTTPATAWWFGWFTVLGELKNPLATAAGGTGVAAKTAYVNALWATLGTLDPRDV